MRFSKDTVNFVPLIRTYSPRKVLKCLQDADKLGDMRKSMETVPIRILERDLKYFSPEEQTQLLEKKKSLKVEKCKKYKLFNI